MMMSLFKGCATKMQMPLFEGGAMMMPLFEGGTMMMPLFKGYAMKMQRSSFKGGA